VPSSKRKFDRSSISPDALTGFFDAWALLACEFGEIEISGWQGNEGSNSLVDEILSFSGFIQAYHNDPPRAFVSGRTAGKAVEISVNYLRGAGVQVFIRMPASHMIDEVFQALEADAKGGSATECAPIGPSHEYGTGRPDAQTKDIPIHIDDSVSLAQRTGNDVIIAKLRWGVIDEEEFERLLFNIVANAEDYNNPQWLMRINAPDRGRDISVERMTKDTLSEIRIHRVIIQAKHWLSKSVRPDDISSAITQMALWEPPLVNVLVMATSGRFTVDAVTWVERHNQAGARPLVEMWPESHLELILANMPGIIDQFGLG